MARRLAVFVTIGFAIFANACAGSTNATQKNVAAVAPTSVRLVIAEFCADKTTESGADEVYVLLLGRRTDGQSVATRAPSDKPHEDAGHWDMNDGDQKKDNADGDAHCRTDKTLFTGSLAPGQSWDLNVLFMEEDGGTTKPFQELAAAIASSSGNPYAVAGGGILAGITALGGWVKDKDDYLGNFGVHIENQNGKISAQWIAKERIVHSDPDPSDKGNPLHREFRMNGDASNYVAWMQVR